MGHAEDWRDFPPTPPKKSTARPVVGPPSTPPPPESSTVPDDLFGPVPHADGDRVVDTDLLRFPEWPKAEPTPSFDLDDWFPESDESRETNVLAQPRIVHVAPDPRSPRTPWRRHGRKLLVGLGGIAVIGVLAVTSDAISPRFASGVARASGSPVNPSFEDAAARVVTAAEFPAPHVVGPRASYSVALASYRGRSLAVAHRDALAAAAPEHLFVLAPLMVNGQLFHRVLGGLAEGEAEMGTVVQEISTSTGNPSSPWLVRETHLAFTIDEMVERSAAERRVADLRELGIPAYALSVLYSDESTAHRVLAGAYATASEAEYLGRILLDHELGSTKLEQRVGILSR